MAERPLECSQCKKPVKVIYKEIVGNSITTTEMCADCPILQEKLHGAAASPLPEKEQVGQTELCCGNCHTGLSAIKMDNPLGCSECYALFTEALINELLAMGKLPSRLQKTLSTKKSELLHSGKTPTQPVTITISSRLTAMNEALNEALKKENYEQAAWLRDQIKTLMEGKSGTP